MKDLGISEINLVLTIDGERQIKFMLYFLYSLDKPDINPSNENLEVIYGFIYEGKSDIEEDKRHTILPNYFSSY